MVYENKIQDIIEAQNGNQDMMTKLIEENNGLIWSIIKRFKDRGYELEDLYQIGTIGFIKSIKRFDTTFDVRLSTYAVPYILGEVKRFIRDDGSVKISRSIKELAIKIREIQNKYILEKNRDITIEEIEQELNVNKEDITLAIDAMNPIVSIYDSSYSNDENGISFIDTLSTKVDEAEQIANKISLNNAIENLDKRDKEIIMLRYYKNKTQKEVAKLLQISQVQVSRIEKRVLTSMREKLAI